MTAPERLRAAARDAPFLARCVDDIRFEREAASPAGDARLVGGHALSPFRRRCDRHDGVLRL